MIKLNKKIELIYLLTDIYTIHKKKLNKTFFNLINFHNRILLCSNA
ncbi:protein of unknown function [Brochothrix thermosphacta]|nr:hypothetical protein FM106_03795 [Brachybacterium faecium]SPN70864.1 protein of unknown function [Brochothrix thermosphacta]